MNVNCYHINFHLKPAYSGSR